MALLNINCLLKHVDELRTLMLHKPLDALAINESKLSQNDNNDSVDLVGYTVERRDKFGGGVCIYLRDSIQYKRRLDLETIGLEAIVLEITKPNSQSFIIITWHRPPKVIIIQYIL